MNVRLVSLVLALIALLSTAIGGYFVNQMVKTSALQEAEWESFATTAHVRGYVSALISYSQKDARVLASFARIKKALEKKTEPTLSDANKVLDTFATEVSADVCYLMDRSGLTIASSNRNSPDSFVGKNYSFRPYFTEAIQGRTGMYIALGVTSGKTGLYCSYPVYQSDREGPIGVVVVKTDAEHFEKVMESQPGCITLLVDSSGIVFASTRKDWALNLLWRVPPEELPQIEASGQFGKGPWKWTGLEKKGSQQAVDSSGELYLLEETTIPDMPQWRIVQLHSLKALSGKIVDPLVGKTGYVALLAVVLVGCAIIVLFRMSQHDVRTRDLAEEALRESEERYRTIADFTHDWESWTGPDGEFLWVSPSCERITGYPAKDFLEDRTLFERIVYQDDLDLVMNHLNEPLDLEHMAPHSLDFRIVRRDGEVRWINHVCQLVVGEGGNLLGKRSSNRDVTARIDAETLLKASEDRFRSIYENSPVMMHSIDETGIVRNVNKRWLEVLGYSREEVLGRTISCVMTPESASRAVSTILPQYWRYGSVRDVPYQYITKDGTVIDVLLDSVVMEDPVLGKTSLSVVRNITLRKRAEEETQRTKALLNSIIQNLPTSIFLKDAEELKYVLWNRASEVLYGYSRDEVMGKTAHDFFPKEQANRFNEQDRAALTSGQLLYVSEQFVDTKDKGTRIVHTKKLPILDDDGRPRYLLGISEDITERKEAEQALINARELAEEASRAKSEFLANMSHEIRTPINGIMGMTQLALNTQLTAEQVEYLEAVETSADALLRIINDILDFSKMEAGKLELISIDFSLRDSIAETMTTLAVSAHTKGLELLYDIPSNVPDAVIGDPGRLRQILLNLVANAIKFTEQGEVAVKIEPESETGDEIRLHFSIADTGIGIPAEKQQKIFNAFEQADGSTSRKYGGTGLGLAISSELVRLMGGRIWLESEAGKGSIFHFTVRFGLQRELVQPLVVGDPSAFKDLAVLVVDDNATNRRILEETLLQWRVKPTIVDSGAAALSSMKSVHEEGRHFDLVITDCMMPEMDGFELVETINQDARWTTPTIIMLTSAGERGDAARCINLGIAAYLLKPIKQSELFFTISRVLREPQPDPARPSLITRHSIRESTQRLQILLVEDNIVNQKLAGKMLEKMGHSVTVAANGQEVLDTLEGQNFDLILMDVQMPMMDGLEATRILREREKTSGQHVPIVAMTAYAMKGDKEKCLEAGMDGYVSKPINAQELFETIEDLFKKKDTDTISESRPAPRNQILDQTELLERVGGDEVLLKEIVDLFIADYPKLVSDIRMAIREGDSQRLEKAAHALKGSVGNFASQSAFQSALRLEIMGRDQDMSQAPEAMIDLENKISQLQEQLVSFIEEMER